MASAVCPECEAEIAIAPKPYMGQLITCPSCGTDLELVSLSPLELDWALIDSDEDLGEEQADDEDQLDVEDWEDVEDDWDDDEDWEDEEGDDL